jgi:SAM-dependent methyltransferase
MPSIKDTQDSLKAFFDDRASVHGPVVQSVDWSSVDRQICIFQQLLKVWQNKNLPSSVLDYGCGYGALLAYLLAEGYSLESYTGYDFSSSMIANAKASHEAIDICSFTDNSKSLVDKDFDYVIASGLFSMKMLCDATEWEDYCFSVISELWRLSRKGIAFNSLTIYSDQDKVRNNLFYADPCRFFDFCKRNLSRNVALLHDYEHYEFTILVRA